MFSVLLSKALPEKAIGITSIVKKKKVKEKVPK
jgi:hypothetical protein